MTRRDERRIIWGQEVGGSNPPTLTIDMPRPSGPLDCRDICADYPWVREVWLLAFADVRSEPSGATDLLVVCDRSPRAVGPGQRKRFLGDLQTRSDQRLDLRLATAGQLSGWLSQKGRFAAAFRNAVRLYP